MNQLAAFFAWIFDPAPVAAQRRAEQYLSQSTDMCDLERRMRDLDQGRAYGPYASGL